MAKLLFLQKFGIEFLGPMYISSFVKRSHDCRLAIGESLRDFEKVIDAYRPDIVAFPTRTLWRHWTLALARDIKKRYGVRTLFGGAHPTCLADFIREDGVDIICRGEGEEAVLELLDCIDDGKDIRFLRNLSVKQDGKVYRNEVRPLPANLDAYPFPDRTLYYRSRTRRQRLNVPVITSRGCPFHCSFCYENILKELYRGQGTYVRTRSIDSVIRELRELKESIGAETIDFCDHVFGIDGEWTRVFLERYRREIGLPFQCYVRPDVVSANERLAKQLGDAGCDAVRMSIETASEMTRNNLLNRGVSDRQIFRASELLHGAGIRLNTWNILGLPGESLEETFETARMNIAVGADLPQCSMFTPYPGTAVMNDERVREYVDHPGGTGAPSILSLPNIRPIANFYKFFPAAVSWPFLLPLIKVLVRLPPNYLFDLWFALVNWYLYARARYRRRLQRLFS